MDADPWTGEETGKRRGEGTTGTFERWIEDWEGDWEEEEEGGEEGGRLERGEDGGEDRGEDAGTGAGRIKAGEWPGTTSGSAVRGRGPRETV